MARIITIFGCFFCVPFGASADNWPAWRGPSANGHSPARNLPIKWSLDENVRWKTFLPGPGNSTPAIWGERIFVTQAVDSGRRRQLLCFNRQDGKLIWQKEIEHTEKESTHNTNHYCSASPATDGERIVVSHGSAGVFCYDFAGAELWRRDLGRCEHIWGNAASPLLYKDVVIQNFGPGERTFLIALDKRTGKDVWKVEEPGGKYGEKPSDWLGSWSTPVIAAVNGRDELIMSWPDVVKAYNPLTGELLWTCNGLSKLVYTSPLVGPDIIVAMAGYHGPFLAVRPGGKGDVTESHRLWHQAERMPQRIGSGVIIGEHIYMANAGPGSFQCIELKTGKTLWTERLGDACWGSLIYADGRLYVADLQGETFVLAAEPTFKLLSRNPLKEATMASLAVAGGDIFVRTHAHLWCIGKLER